MFEVREKPSLVERALLVGVYFDREDEAESRSLLEELRELVHTLDVPVAGELLVRAPKQHARYLMGTGKSQEVIALAKSLNCDCIIFDNELSPAQQRAWENDAGLCVIDRQEVILDIFHQRARTKEARLQVELARLEYSLPRLARMWRHLDRQSGALGGRGEGEKQLEIDRRLARQRIDRLRLDLDAVRRQRSTRRKERERLPLPHAAIVGYTNAGKSTLLNSATGSQVLVEDKLFATLDTTTRRVILPDGQALLLTDTVGFVRRLPHRLVEAFKATLEEALLADFLVHVLDASQPSVFQQYHTTREVLQELGAEEKRILVVLNKIDLVDDPLRRRALEQHFPKAPLVSAKTGYGLERLLQQLNSLLLDKVQRVTLRFPQSRHDLLARLHREGKVLRCDYEDETVLVQAVLPRRLLEPLRDFLLKTPGAVAPPAAAR